MSITAYPLLWPVGWKRATQRTAAGFSRNRENLTVSAGRDRVLAELRRMGLRRDDVVISTNLALRLDGEVRADARAPADPGVAVYWETRGGGHRVMAIDRYTRCADNLAAVAATLDAMRAIERHGGAVVLERAFTGFTALPAPAKSSWRPTLAYPDDHTPDAEDLLARWRERRGRSHPDRGGDPAAFDAINRAYEQAKQELGYV